MLLVGGWELPLHDDAGHHSDDSHAGHPDTGANENRAGVGLDGCHDQGGLRKGGGREEGRKGQEHQQGCRGGNAGVGVQAQQWCGTL
jgi:hypothetical protein